MSLPPSGRMGETHQALAASDQTTASSAPSLPKALSQEQRQTGSPIDPVIGSISLRDIQSAVPGAESGEKSRQPEVHSHCDVDPDAPAQGFTKIRPKSCSRPAKAAGKEEEHIGRENDPIRVQAKDEVRVPRKRGRPRKTARCEKAVVVVREEMEPQENVTRDSSLTSEMPATRGKKDWATLLQACLKRQPRVVLRRVEKRNDGVEEQRDNGVTEKRDDEVVKQRDDEVREQRNDEVTKWRDDEVAEQRGGEVVKLRDDGVTEQRDDKVVEQRDDRVTDLVQKGDESTSVLKSCMRRQLRVVIQRLDMSSPAIQALLNGPPAAVSEPQKRSLSRRKKGQVTVRKRKRTRLTSPKKTLLSSENKE